MDEQEYERSININAFYPQQMIDEPIKKENKSVNYNNTNFNSFSNNFNTNTSQNNNLQTNSNVENNNFTNQNNNQFQNNNMLTSLMSMLNGGGNLNLDNAGLLSLLGSLGGNSGQNSANLFSNLLNKNLVTSQSNDKDMYTKKGQIDKYKKIKSLTD